MVNVLQMLLAQQQQSQILIQILVKLVLVVKNVKQLLLIVLNVKEVNIFLIINVALYAQAHIIKELEYVCHVIHHAKSVLGIQLMSVLNVEIINIYYFLQHHVLLDVLQHIIKMKLLMYVIHALVDVKLAQDPLLLVHLVIVLIIGM